MTEGDFTSDEMVMRDVSVERYVEQVINGSHYKGYVKIDDTKLDYELVFKVPIASLDSMDPPQEESGIRQLFQITVRRDNANIELTKEEYSFFFSMVVEMAVEFYNDEQTRNSNEGMLGDILQGRGGIMDTLVVSMSIGMTIRGSCSFPPVLCEMLSAPKFGCVLIDT